MSSINHQTKILSSKYEDIELSGKNYFETIWSKSDVLANKTALVSELYKFLFKNDQNLGRREE